MKARLYRHIMRLFIRIGHNNMHAAITTVAFRGIETILVEVQVQIANGLTATTIAGLADKAVAESREWVLLMASTISNLARSEQIDRPHLAEALAYRAMPLLG